MDLFKFVGEQIRELRKNYGTEGISQDALAKAISVATNTVSRWETATYQPTLRDLENLSKFFNVSVLTFFPKEEISENDSMKALLRAAQNLPDTDIDELRRYAEFRTARSMYTDSKKPSRGRKRNSSK